MHLFNLTVFLSSLFALSRCDPIALSMNGGTGEMVAERQVIVENYCCTQGCVTCRSLVNCDTEDCSLVGYPVRCSFTKAKESPAQP